MVRHNRRVDRGTLRLVLDALPGGDRVPDGLEIEIARRGADQAVEDQCIARHRIHNDRSGPKGQPGSAGLLLAPVAIMSRVVRSLLGVWGRIIVGAPTESRR